MLNPDNFLQEFPGMACKIDESGMIHDANGKWHKETRGLSVFDLIQDVSDIRDVLSDVIKNNSVKKYKTRLVSDGDNNLYYECIFSKTDDGMVNMFISDEINKQSAGTFESEIEAQNEYLYQWSRRIQHVKNYAQLLELVAEAISEKMNFNTSWVFMLPEPDAEFAVILAASGLAAEDAEVEAQMVPLKGDPFLEEVMVSNAPVIVHDARTDSRVNREIVEALGSRTIMNMALNIMGETVGIMGTGSFGDEGVKGVSPIEKDFFIKMAGQVAAALERIRYLEERRKVENELLQAKNEAEKASAAKTEFLSRMSHELRTPLNAILGFGQLLQLDQDNLNNEQNEAAEHIVHSGGLLLELINEVLDIASVDAGKMEMSIEDVELDDVIDECLAMIEPLRRSNDVEIIKKDLPAMLRADRGKLKQVVMNVLSNAIKYNRKGGQIYINLVESASDQVRLEVRDTGYGIREKEKARIFEPFFRGGNSSEAIEGTGVGLALVKKIIDMMGGNVSFSSLEDEGTTFWIEMPLAMDKSVASSV